MINLYRGYEDILEYYLKTRKNYDKPKPEIERSKDGPNLNYAELNFYEESLDYYLEVIGQ
ncbi:MAG: hypothetical protein O7C59_11980 [Rickettsia endosymbiont of Ixodes persulcatus]|nr:hypothetical protein [Rickettsia endosymbiont of Ixodes persulcatus]MCZ6903955.1 hypothetical protein [Rickettsia endosymbiont of Ixodes persulcatus]MCZ6908846.1 hypothetical protein [Rickettsia endosymbiont of Ixodes persulcatus]MCZ6910901.1 hypothetical protein [Rickettsia endosymbiont of Ixodes persulcatus]MCZ6915066.1 hypothetical protein [Rickettsia endosymbiont of Ixodes persulcatus]